MTTSASEGSNSSSSCCCGGTGASNMALAMLILTSSATCVDAFQPNYSRAPDIRRKLLRPLQVVKSSNAGMEQYDAMLQQAYRAQTTTPSTVGSKSDGVARAGMELKQTTDALTVALDELKEIRELMAKPEPPSPMQQEQQPPPQQPTQTQTQLQQEGQLKIETKGGPLARPMAVKNSSESLIGTPNKWQPSTSITPLSPPTRGTNIDVDRLPSQPRYLTTSQERRLAKTESARDEASIAFARGSAGYYGRRYGVYSSPYGYGPWHGRYGSSYWDPYNYGGWYDPFIYDYGYGNYYGDGRRNSLLWGTERVGPDFYADQVEYAERQRDFDKERGNQEYAQRYQYNLERLNGTGNTGGANAGTPTGNEQQQQQQKQQQAAPSSQPQMMENSGRPNTNNVDEPKTSSPTFSYLESMKENSSALTTSQPNNGENAPKQGDAPYAEAEQVPLDRRGGYYDRYNTSYGDFRYRNSFWDPYYSYGYGGYGYYGGYGGIRGGDWFSDQLRRSERERVWDANARSRWGGYYAPGGYYGGWGRNMWSDYTFRPRDYV